ncbi:acyl-CoA dehydrogenase family protein [Sphingobium sp. YBL2]|uniref:acyl-CoA dehydrogenase family protein n=1 Tax=Sphingobium sp. (strain YBL2) TaxID=484429 RepID=UPI0005CBC082|nr:acyl-CoA dehydrogenase family protein [Sphingobium sp. YBL2]AJR24173.1 acyl-CoA dehydrogenase [Sphingobium sp. YBL2]
MTEPAELDSLSDEAFRKRLRDWLEEYYPPEWRRPVIFRLRGDSEKRWLRLMHDHGWRLPSWPKEYGGLGLPLTKQLAYHEEMAQFGTARWLDMGGTLLGPTLIKFGTPEQKAKYLPEIVRGDVIWCQGYSEPNAGSDLASLKTTARRDGDHFVVNGTKIWTTMATDAQRMFLLVRTSQEERKQQGISFLLADMDLPGITVEPIVNLAGEDEFAQVFLDDVRVPAENLVGEPGQGWTVAKALLGVERITTASPAPARYAFDVLDRLISFAQSDQHALRQLHGQLLCDLEDYVALYAQTTDAYIDGRVEGHELCVLKMLSSDLFQRISEACLQAAGERGGSRGAVPLGADNEDLRLIYLIARPTSIYGGANDVQRDIIARAIFGSRTTLSR